MTDQWGLILGIVVFEILLLAAVYLIGRVHAYSEMQRKLDSITTSFREWETVRDKIIADYNKWKIVFSGSGER